MGRRKKSIFKKTYISSISFIKLFFTFTLNSIFHPKSYARIVSRQTRLFYALGFFGVNLFVFFFLQSIINIASQGGHLYLYFYLAEAALKMFSGILIGVIAVIFWHFFSKSLGGKASFKLGIITLCFSSTPLLFYWVTFLQPVIFIYFLLGLMLNFRRSYKYPLIFSVIAILVPTILVLIWLKSINLVELPF